MALLSSNRLVSPVASLLPALLLATSAAQAATLFESGTLGPTGVTFQDILDGNASGSNVTEAVFVGVRFELTEPVLTSHIGGHFLQSPGAASAFFGAIVTLDSPSDFPDSGNLSSDDVIGTTLLEFPQPSGEVLGALAVRVDPGFYALVFGSGQFGASGSGVATSNNSDVASPSYIAWQPGVPGSGWFNLSGPFSDFYFVVAGVVVPEPSGCFMVAWFSLILVPRQNALKYM